MRLLVKSEILYVTVLFALQNIVLCDDSEEESSGEDPIRQALLLIQLIRRAGTELQNNALFSKHDAIQGPAHPDAPESPLQVSTLNNTSTIPPDQNYRRKMPKEIKEINYRKVLPKEKHKPENRQIIRSKNRNKFKPKLQPDSVPSSPSGADISSSKSSNISFTTAKTTVYVGQKTPSKGQNKNKSPQKYSNKREQMQLNAPFEGKTQSHVPILDQEEAKNPVMKQVASELQYEMVEMNGKDRSDAENALQKFTNIIMEKIQSRTNKPLITVRVHLGSSTRYPVPFPANHALCYTDPQNGLCRTPL